VPYPNLLHFVPQTSLNRIRYDWNEIDRALREGLPLLDLPTKVVRSGKYLGFIDYKREGFVMKLIKDRKI